LTRHRSFPLSEGVRGMASLAIIVVHVWLATLPHHGDLANRFVFRLDACIGVFFALSAFLLYRPMIAHRGGGPAGPSTGDFARRRFFRIFPTYWFTLTCLAIFPGLAGVFSGQGWAYYSLVSNWIPHYADADCFRSVELCGLPQTWTLSTELSFYLVLPLYAYLTARIWRRAGDRWVGRELMLIAGLAAASTFAAVGPFGLREHTWFTNSFLAHAAWLGLGLAAAVLSVAFQRRHALPDPLSWLAEHPGHCYGAALALYLFMVATLPGTPFRFERDGGTYLAMTMGHMLMGALILTPVVFGNPNQGQSRRFLGHPAMVWLGLISYGLYLWHFSIAYYLGIGDQHAGFGLVLFITLALSVPLAAFNWYAIEKPLMRFKYRRRRPSEVTGGPPVEQTPDVDQQPDHSSST
jgi:peptidoglycan/LPS O-acetylase OafA/YrhL